MPAQQVSIEREDGIEQRNHGVYVADRPVDFYVTRGVLEFVISCGFGVAES